MKQKNETVLKLAEKMTLHSNGDLLQAAQHYQLGYETLTRLLDKTADFVAVDFVAMAKLAHNMVWLYTFFGMGVENKKIDDHLIVRSLRLIQIHLEKNSLWWATLNTDIARLYISGFHYRQANNLLKESIKVEQELVGQETPYSLLAEALYWENYGVALAQALPKAFAAYQRARNLDFQSVIAAFIAYQLGLIGHTALCRQWLAKVNMNSAQAKMWKQISFALLEDDPDKALEILDGVELRLMRFNPEAPFLSRVYYVRSVIYGRCGLVKSSSEYYKKYTNLVQTQFASSDGAKFCLLAGRCQRLIDIGALTTAKSIVVSLEELDLANQDYALSVRLDACFVLAWFYQAAGDFMEAEHYCTNGLELSKQLCPNEETVEVLSKLFGGAGSIPENSYLWNFEYQQLRIAIDKKIPTKAIREKIDWLVELFPKHNVELKALAASLLPKIDAAMFEFGKLILTSDPSENAALHCAHAAELHGYIYEAALYYRMFYETPEFLRKNRYDKATVLLDAAINLDECGGAFKNTAECLWISLEQLAFDSPELLADIYQAHANTLAEDRHYSQAIEFYYKALAVIQPEEDSLFDERLSSIYGNLSACFGAIKDYNLAYDCAQKAYNFYPGSSFNLCYNLSFFGLATERVKEARKSMAEATKLVYCVDEREALQELNALLSLSPSQRKAYFE